MTNPRTARRSRIADLRPAQLALATTILIAPELMGGAPGWATVVLTVLSGITAAMTFWLARGYSTGRGLAIEPFVVAQALAVALTVVRVVPWPARLAAAIAPDSYAHANAAAQALQRPPPAWIALTLDPGGSYERVLFGLAVLSVFSTARLLTRALSPTVPLIAVAAAAFLAALVSLAHVAMGATRVFGIYEPRFLPPPVLGPLLNTNNLAGLLALGAPVMLGFACRGDYSRRQRLIWHGCAVVTLATAFSTLSRGGITVSALGVLVFYGLYVAKFKTKNAAGDLGPAQVAVLGGGVLLTALSLAWWVGSDPLSEDFADLTKLEFFAQVFRLLREHPVLGVGRGAFSAAMSGFYEANGRALYAENIVLQYATEFGVPCAVLMLGVFFWRLLMGLAHCRSPLQLGGLTGILAIALQNLVDFSLELSGLALVAAASFGASLPPAQRLSRVRGALPKALGSRSLAGIAGAATLAGCLCLGPTVAFLSIDEVEPLLYDALEGGDAAPFTTVLPKAVELHPADPTLAVLGAANAVRTSSPSAAAWLNRAMALAPFWSSPHSWAAHWLASVGHWDQALSELQIAAERDPRAAGPTLCTMLKAQARASIALAVAPNREPARTLVLEGAAECLAPAVEEVAQIDAELLKLHPLHPDATAREARRSAEGGDWQRALAMLKPLLAKVPPHPTVYDSATRAWIAAGRPDRAVQLITAALPSFTDPYLPLLTLANAQAHAGDLAGTRATIETARGATRGDINRLAAALNMLATIELQSGNLARSLRVWKELYSLRHDPASLATAAGIATRLGDSAFAREAAYQLCSGHAAQGYCDRPQEAAK